MTRYHGTCWVGVVGGETENGECHDSILHIARRQGDSPVQFFRGTKGYEVRQLHINHFMESQHEFILMLDHDMVYPGDTLERLRSHLIPFVSGYYMRRRFAPLAPVWFKPGTELPLMPWLDEPERGKLHEIGASGWGCILIHREVILETRKILKGELEILEDDMDIMPYSLERISGALRGLKWLANNHEEMVHRDALKPIVEALAEEIQPLRVRHDQVGSDIRFPYYARMAGYPLMGDPDCRAGHMLNYPLTPDDYSATPNEAKIDTIKKTQNDVDQEREEISRAKEACHV
jgi:hypothetical protein